MKDNEAKKYYMIVDEFTSRVRHGDETEFHEEKHVCFLNDYYGDCRIVYSKDAGRVYKTLEEAQEHLSRLEKWIDYELQCIKRKFRTKIKIAQKLHFYSPFYWSDWVILDLKDAKLNIYEPRKVHRNLYIREYTETYIDKVNFETSE